MTEDRVERLHDMRAGGEASGDLLRPGSAVGSDEDREIGRQEEATD